MRSVNKKALSSFRGIVMAVAIVLSSVGLLEADDVTGQLNTFSSGTTISSSQVNGNFTFLAKALPRLKVAVGNSVTASSNAQNLATLAVTPQINGSLLLLANAGVIIEQGTQAGGQSWGYSSCSICVTQTSNGKDTCDSVVLDTVSVANAGNWAPRIQVPVTIYRTVPVTKDTPVTYYLTTYFEPGSVGTCLIQGSGLTAIFIPGGYMQ